MAKSKNHTNHNQNHKDHRNGIKRPKKQRYISMKGVDPKFLRNLKYVRRFTIRALRKQRKELKQKKAAEATTPKSEP